MSKFFTFCLTICALSLVQVACDKACDIDVYSNTEFTNNTGKELKLNVCSDHLNSSSKKQYSLTIPVNLNGVIMLESARQSTIYAGGDKNACEAKSYSYRSALMQQSFNDAKFCVPIDTSLVKIVIVDLQTPCPDGTQAQPVGLTSCP